MIKEIKVINRKVIGIQMKVLGIIKRWIIHLLIRVFWLFPIDKKKIFCVSYYGKGFGDNGKAVVLQLLNKSPNLKIVWGAYEQYKDSIPKPIRFVRYHSLHYYYELATAGVWLDNSRKERDSLKRKGQYYVQLWHGTVPLKKIEKDAEEQLGEGYIREAKWDSKLADLITSGCGLFTEICRKSFWYDGEILKSGEPRVDILFEEKDETKQKVREALGIDGQKRIILYAPTFRTDERTDCYQLHYERILSLLREQTGEEWVVAVRLHPNIANKADFINYSADILNATHYPDLYELFSVVDILFTDYSSLMFEGGLLKKPVYLFANDIDEYIKERGFYFELRDLPFPVAENNEELIQLIQAFDQQRYDAKVDAFYRDIEYYPAGKASDIVANRILEVLK